MNDVAEMLALSRKLISEIQHEITKLGSQPICHHFSSEKADYDSPEERQYLNVIIPALTERGLDVDAIGGPFGVEAWERTEPNEAWVSSTVPAMCAIGDKAGCIYQGWSWEPPRVPT